MEALKIGDVVKSNAHPNKMCVRSIENDKAVCDYFIGAKPFQETHPIVKLTKLV